MQTVFSYIVQHRLSKESENVATAAVAFILGSSDTAKNGMMKLLRGVIPALPELWFRTQQAEESSRPDMWGADADANPHVFIENKFWAGFTDNQPVSYLRILAARHHPTALVVVVPEARGQTVWRELKRRLDAANISLTDDPKPPAGIIRSGTTSLASFGPVLALTSWKQLLSFLELETADDVSARSDLLQLRALCEEANSDAFVPFSSEEISDQRAPSLVLKLNAIVKEVWEQAYDNGIFFNRTSTRPTADSRRIGIYASILSDNNCGLFFGLHFALWKKHGGTPIWGYFDATKWPQWGRASEVRALLEPWATQRGILVANEPDGSFVVAFDIPYGEEKDLIVEAIVKRLSEIASLLSVLKPRAAVDGGPWRRT